MKYRPIVEVLRGGKVESIHSGALAVVDTQGKLLASWGDPNSVIFLRSSAKPLQVLPLLEAGGEARYGLSLQQIAVMCASHSGAESHIQIVESIQEVVEISEADLLCGTHLPIDKEAANRLIRAGETPTPNHHNCSGKHTGMLALGKILALSQEGYIEHDHPVQRRILAVIAEMTDVEKESILLGIDGCSAPIFGLPLQAAAKAFARLADPSGLSSKRAAACRKVFHSMTSRPQMVAGEGRFDTALMAVSNGSVLAKGGAEGVQALAIAGDVLGHGSPGVGIVIKIADGDPKGRAKPLVALEVLRGLGALDKSQYEELAKFDQRIITNWRDVPVGALRHRLHLEIDSWEAP